MNVVVLKINEKMTKKQQTAAASKVRMLDGSIPRNSGERLSEWCKYFLDLLNNNYPNYNASNRPSSAPSDYENIPTFNFRREEIIRAISHLKRGKSPGPEYAITEEVLKHGGHFIFDQPRKILNTV